MVMEKQELKERLELEIEHFREVRILLQNEHDTGTNFPNMSRLVVSLLITACTYLMDNFLVLIDEYLTEKE